MDAPELTSLPLVNQGKVRDIYAVDDDHLLIVASDRLSAFDVVLPDPIPGKGEVLTSLSLFWFDFFSELLPNHLAGLPLTKALPDAGERAGVAGRAMVVRRLRPLPIEAVVRGYLAGSGWKDYQETGAICGQRLPAGLQQAQPLPEPLFTPATKAAPGEHDENISLERMRETIGGELADQVKDLTLRIYTHAAQYTRKRGIIIADTKLEFGVDDAGRLILIDEVLTPDSSRLWPAEDYRTGVSPPSFDKQYVRDYLEHMDWDKRAPGPRLPDDVIRQTTALYREAQERLTAR
jgi:phosphoribosylaminoimidazole-succinocarboxamide synthase